VENAPHQENAMTRKIKLFVLLISLGVVFAAFPRKSAAQFNQPGQRKTLLLPGAEVSRAALRRRARGARETFALPIPSGATEAPTGLELRTNGLVTQEKFDEAAAEFRAVDSVAEGLGPLRNGDSCADCHRNPFGAFGTTIEINAGHNEKRAGKRVFIPAPGGTIIALLSTNIEFQERVPPLENLRSLRTTVSTLGLGFLEAISLQTRVEIAERQFAETNGRIRGSILMVDDPEAPGGKSPGAFGHKGAVSRLDLFAAGAYQVEVGITNPRFPQEQTSLGASVAEIDPAPDPEDDGEDVELFAIFMRASLAPSRSPLATTQAAKNGERTFQNIGCARCHVPTLVTAPAGTRIGSFVVPAQLALKIVHPFTDMLLHDIGTGDGIPAQDAPIQTANLFRTSPLWLLRAKPGGFLHDARALSVEDAILRHDNEARVESKKFKNLGAIAKRDLFLFLETL
jgi:CxxC motif-containing protein (DUF1111 family)